MTLNRPRNQCSQAQHGPGWGQALAFRAFGSKGCAFRSLGIELLRSLPIAPNVECCAQILQLFGVCPVVSRFDSAWRDWQQWCGSDLGNPAWLCLDPVHGEEDLENAKIFVDHRSTV